MKKLLLIFILAIIFAYSQSFAVVVTERKIYKDNSVSNPAPTVTRAQTKDEKTAKYIKTCQPYSEKLNTEYMGVNVSFDLKIVGWVGNKCRINFDANTYGAGESFTNTYGIDPSQAQIISFAPKIRCDFSKQQLEYVGDSILQEVGRRDGTVNNMLKNPNNINIPSPSELSASDMKLLDVVINQGACTILNTQDLNNMMQLLMQ